MWVCCVSFFVTDSNIIHDLLTWYSFSSLFFCCCNCVNFHTVWQMHSSFFLCCNSLFFLTKAQKIQKFTNSLVSYCHFDLMECLSLGPSTDGLRVSFSLPSVCVIIQTGCGNTPAEAQRSLLVLQSSAVSEREGRQSCRESCWRGGVKETLRRACVRACVFREINS